MEHDAPKPLRLIPREEATQAALNADVIETLERALAEARKGEICSIVLIASHAREGWSHEQSGVMDFAATIGRLEIVKTEWITQYTAAMKEPEHGG
jgi:hypothetical protein